MARLEYNENCGCLVLEGSERDQYALETKSCLDRKDAILHDRGHKEETKKVFELFGRVLPEKWEKVILAIDINPYVMRLNYNLVVYFGEDKPQLFTKTVKSCTKEYKRWTKNNYKEYKPETYAYVKVKEPEKLFIFGNTYDFNNCEIIEQSGDSIIARFDLSQEMYEKLASERIAKEKAEMKRRQDYAAELERRKELPGYCSCCGSEHAHLTVNPFNAEMYGDFTPVWLCMRCYESYLGDI